MRTFALAAALAGALSLALAALPTPATRAQSAAIPGAAPGAALAPATRPDARPVIRVKNVHEFLKAIGPDRIIELEEGDYPLLDARRGAGPHIKWNQELDSFELTIRNCDRLTLRGAGDKPAHITTPAPYSNVLCFLKCNDLELVNLKLGHAPKPGYCIGGVIKAESCERVTLRNLDLYGCGIDGLQLREVKKLAFINSIIHDCTYGIVNADDCEDLRFVNSSFRKIEELYGFQLGSSTGVSFVDCTVEDVTIKDALFQTNLSDPDLVITFKGGAIRNNRAKALVNTAGMLRLEGVKSEENTWRPLGD